MAPFWLSMPSNSRCYPFSAACKGEQRRRNEWKREIKFDLINKKVASTADSPHRRSLLPTSFTQFIDLPAYIHVQHVVSNPSIHFFDSLCSDDFRPLANPCGDPYRGRLVPKYVETFLFILIVYAGTFFEPALGACGKTNTASQLIVAVAHGTFDTFP